MKIINLRTLKNDIIIYKKLMNEPKYINKLDEVKKIIEPLNIQDESIYYQYQIVLKSLTEFNYFEATFLKRIKDKDYLMILNRVINLFGSNKKIRFYQTKILEFKKRGCRKIK